MLWRRASAVAAVVLFLLLLMFPVVLLLQAVNGKHDPCDAFRKVLEEDQLHVLHQPLQMLDGPRVHVRGRQEDGRFRNVAAVGRRRWTDVVVAVWRKDIIVVVRFAIIKLVDITVCEMKAKIHGRLLQSHRGRIAHQFGKYVVVY